MTSRERVKAALEFEHPDRVPRDLWVLPYGYLYRREEVERLLQQFPLDFERVELYEGQAEEGRQRLAKRGRYVDDWGSEWEIAVPGTIGEVRKPALADWSGLNTWQPPWHLIRDTSMDHVNRVCASTDLFTLPPVTARPFERLQFIRGTENVYLDLAYDTLELRRLLEMVHAYYVEEMEKWASSDVDGIFLMDDWGTQESMMISPTMWRERFKPLYKEYCDILHAGGKYVFFHTDGFVEPIYEDFVEVGFDAVNSQLFCMDIEGLADRLKGKVTFWGEIDRQQVLPFGTPQEVKQAVRRVRAALDDGTGGVIAQCEWGKDNEPENIAAVFEAWLE